MKNYRVWEANRKVFLYPENWIEPELRDDKSPFFKELESELLESDLTLETAEDSVPELPGETGSGGAARGDGRLSPERRRRSTSCMCLPAPRPLRACTTTARE